MNMDSNKQRNHTQTRSLTIITSVMVWCGQWHREKR